MKRITAVLPSLVIILLALVSCVPRSMNYIIANEPSITGVVQEVHDTYILIYVETEGYPTGADCSVSLDVENKDGLYSPISVGDVVTVYFDGSIAESYPLQNNTVYAITLTEPADRAQENQG